MKKQLIISNSGGLSSGFMTYMLLTHLDPQEWEIAVIFGNTGKEKEQTFRFLLDCDKYFNFNTIWVEAVINPEMGKGTRHKVVDYSFASRNGEPFEQMIRKYGIPNICCKHCTRELKINPIRSYAKNVLGWKKFYTAIGIRADEARRVDKHCLKKRFLYPLVNEYPADRIEVNKFWHRQAFTLQLKSYQGNCDLCFEKSDNKLITLCHESPQDALWWMDMEDKYSYYIPPGKNPDTKLPVRFFRKNRSISDFIVLAKEHFVPACDESRIIA
ncbi:MAG: hypothetical protein LBS20_11645 [Prevotella sp.]|jgi:hypothetical protein|nr:hypothetical protein [Prevotella sp.]